MDILDKIDLMDQTVAGDVSTNLAKGSIDVVGGKCPKGQVYDKDKKTCVPAKNESSFSAAIAGSGQTRVWGERYHKVVDLKRKNPFELDNLADKAEENIGRKGTRFNTLLGGYVPEES